MRIRPIAAWLCLGLLACGGGGGRGGSPTEPPGPPPPSGKRFQFTMVAATVDGGLLEAAVSFDGREVSRVDWSRGGGACTVTCGLAADVQGIVPGNHTIRFTVVRQTRTSMRYFVNYGGVLSDPATGQRDPVNSPQQDIRLQAGQSASFTLLV